INQAFAAYTELTCIDFVVRTNQVNYIEFVSKGGCWSYIGRKGGMQEISIGFGCEWKGVVQHELMHALGFWHEQSRPDRDNFVKILTENIIAGKEHNFNKRNSINSLGSPYDLQSIMHYGGNAFSKNRSPTIVDRTTNQIIKAQREKFSDEDRVQLNLLYRC
uniref:Metalloendopeptidase n=1 Tax=Ciona savignyi TaxID=51511 RepID=H2Y7W0_CIOSA